MPKATFLDSILGRPSQSYASPSGGRSYSSEWDAPSDLPTARPSGSLLNAPLSYGRARSAAGSEAGSTASYSRVTHSKSYREQLQNIGSPDHIADAAPNSFTHWWENRNMTSNGATFSEPGDSMTERWRREFAGKKQGARSEFGDSSSFVSSQRKYASSSTGGVAPLGSAPQSLGEHARRAASKPVSSGSRHNQSLTTTTIGSSSSSPATRSSDEWHAFMKVRETPGKDASSSFTTAVSPSASNSQFPSTSQFLAAVTEEDESQASINVVRPQEEFAPLKLGSLKPGMLSRDHSLRQMMARQEPYDGSRHRDQHARMPPMPRNRGADVPPMPAMPPPMPQGPSPVLPNAAKFQQLPQTDSEPLFVDKVPEPPREAPPVPVEKPSVPTGSYTPKKLHGQPTWSASVFTNTPHNAVQPAARSFETPKNESIHAGLAFEGGLGPSLSSMLGSYLNKSETRSEAHTESPLPPLPKHDEQYYAPHATRAAPPVPNVPPVQFDDSPVKNRISVGSANDTIFTHVLDSSTAPWLDHISQIGHYNVSELHMPTSDPDEQAYDAVMPTTPGATMNSLYSSATTTPSRLLDRPRFRGARPTELGGVAIAQGRLSASQPSHHGVSGAESIPPVPPLPPLPPMPAMFSQDVPAEHVTLGHYETESREERDKYDSQAYEQQYEQHGEPHHVYEQRAETPLQYEHHVEPQQEYEQQAESQQEYEQQAESQQEYAQGESQEQYAQQPQEQQGYEQQQAYEQQPYEPQQGYDQQPHETQQAYEQQQYEPQQGYDQQPYEAQQPYEQQPYESQHYEPQQGYEQQPYEPQQEHHAEPQHAYEQQPYEPQQGNEQQLYEAQQGYEQQAHEQAAPSHPEESQNPDESRVSAADSEQGIIRRSQMLALNFDFGNDSQGIPASKSLADTLSAPARPSFLEKSPDVTEKLAPPVPASTALTPPVQTASALTYLQAATTPPRGQAISIDAYSPSPRRTWAPPAEQPVVTERPPALLSVPQGGIGVDGPHVADEKPADVPEAQEQQVYPTKQNEAEELSALAPPLLPSQIDPHVAYGTMSQPVTPNAPPQPRGEIREAMPPIAYPQSPYSYQGTPYQGTPYQGTPYQGTPYQGTPYQGTPYQTTPYSARSHTIPHAVSMPAFAVPHNGIPQMPSVPSLPTHAANIIASHKANLAAMPPPPIVPPAMQPPRAMSPISRAVTPNGYSRSPSHGPVSPAVSPGISPLMSPVAPPRSPVDAFEPPRAQMIMSPMEREQQARAQALEMHQFGRGPSSPDSAHFPRKLSIPRSMSRPTSPLGMSEMAASTGALSAMSMPVRGAPRRVRQFPGAPLDDETKSTMSGRRPMSPLGVHEPSVSASTSALSPSASVAMRSAPLGASANQVVSLADENRTEITSTSLQPRAPLKSDEVVLGSSTMSTVAIVSGTVPSNRSSMGRRLSVDSRRRRSSDAVKATAERPSARVALMTHATPPRKVGSTQVIVQVIAAAIDAIDRAIVREKIQSDGSYGFVPGRSFCGRIVEIGRDVNRLKMGEVVFGLQDARRSGALAEYITIDQDLLVSAPDERLSTEEIAALPSTGIMGHQIVQSHCITLPRGSRILILNAHDGVGLLTMQEARRLGLIIVAQVPPGVPDGATVCRANGANEVVTGDPLWAINLLHESSFSLVVDTIGGRQIYDSCRRIITNNGQFVTSVGDAEVNTSAYRSHMRSLRRAFVKKDRKSIGYELVSIEGLDTRLALEAIRVAALKGIIRPRIQSILSLEDAPRVFDSDPSGAEPGVARVRHGVDRGTVRYVGPLDGDEVWFGIEWDTPRGKHDGVAKGVRYFSCAPMHGSFVRASTQLITGSTFSDALGEKYGSGRAATASLKTVSLTGVVPPPALPDASAVDVATAGDDDIASLFPELRSVDLSRSLVSTWSEAASIASKLRLSELLLHDTRLEYAPSVQLPALKLLGLNAAITWESFALIAPTIPALTHLEIAGNHITDLQPVDLAHLKSINLGSNLLDSWPQVCESLGKLPHLERLVLTDNHLRTIPQPPIHHTYFPSLKYISLIGNPVQGWSDLEALEQWVHGELQLSIGRGSFLEHVNERTARAEAIGRLGKLVELNHTHITPLERTEAERYYVHLARDRPQDTRVAHLATVHEISLAPPSKPATLEQKMISVRVAPLAREPEADDAAGILAGEHARLQLLRTMPLRLATRRVAAACGASPSEAQGASIR
ncbi:hypothetical protein MCUN1_003568 [Malassezia cuniculi]|uniref:CAP-Gly domain-containing protein n=1 Tax=Malassezia cuniculi TaxID=948313 RepID=A0AAF0ETP4_9BASI|nr:hypothetical protein MCUN1_003568 [Malassezia cuniculi]